MTEKLYRLIASSVDARLNCKRSMTSGILSGSDAGTTGVRAEWFEKHTENLRDMAKELLPRGSGFDSGTLIDLDRSTGEHLVLTTSFHHMDEGGCYDGWTDHEVHVTPSLLFGINLRITGRDRNQIKEYMYETFQYDLTREVTHTYDAATEKSTYEVKQ